MTGPQIRVLQVVFSLGRGGGTIGVAMNLYRNIDRARVQFDFLYLDERPDNYKSEILALGGRVFHIEKPGILTAWTFAAKMDAFYREHAGDYSIVHLHELLVNTVCLGLAKKHGVRHRIAHAHSARYSKRPLNSVRNYFLCLFLKRLANSYFACSKAAGERYFGSEKVYLIKNAIDCAKFAYDAGVRDRVRGDLVLQGKFVIGHVGRISKEKNHAFLLEVFSEVNKRMPGAVLLLAGTGKLEAEVRAKARLLGIAEQVRFLGGGAEVPQVLQALDVFVLPSLFEGLPLTLIEAQAAGLRCFASENVTKEAMVTDLVSYISLDKPAAQWAEEILKCRGYERRSGASDVRKSGYDIKDVAAELEKYYLNLVARA